MRFLFCSINSTLVVNHHVQKMQIIFHIRIKICSIESIHRFITYTTFAALLQYCENRIKTKTPNGNTLIINRVDAIFFRTFAIHDGVNVREVTALVCDFASSFPFIIALYTEPSRTSYNAWCLYLCSCLDVALFISLFLGRLCVSASVWRVSCACICKFLRFFP